MFIVTVNQVEQQELPEKKWKHLLNSLEKGSVFSFDEYFHGNFFFILITQNWFGSSRDPDFRIKQI